MASVENHLIERLARRDRRLLLDACEPFALLTAAVLSEPGKPTRHLYFPITGFEAAACGCYATDRRAYLALLR